MLLLGINAFGHDAAAVLLVDGRVAFAASEERFDRVRFSAAFPARAIAAGLAHVGASPRDVDVVAFPWTRTMGRVRKAAYVLARLPASLAFLREPPDALLPGRRAYLAAMASLSRRLAEVGIRAPIARVPHHAAHAASAALLLPDGCGAVLTADGMGEWTTAAIWNVHLGVPRRLDGAGYPHSPGKVYSAVTSWLGFRPEADEGKTMGLAAYGDPESPGARFTRTLIEPRDAGLLRVDVSRLDFPVGRARLYGEAFLRELGPSRHPDEPLRPGDADAARGVQDAVEAFALRAAQRALAATGAASLGLAGGLFLNCAMNGRLARALSVPVQPFPAAGDCGAALGAAALVFRRATGRPAEPLSTLRLGSDLSPASAHEALGSHASRELDDAGAARAVADRLLAGGLVGVARGRAEFGPRALGGRSVLARADASAIRDRLNTHKGRELWRPVAPVLREEDLARWLDDPRPSPHMITTRTVAAAGRAGPLSGAVHADGTARIQSVTRASEPFLHAVLDLTAAAGRPAILNTSLNRRGEPIVDSAREAVDAAIAMRLDALLVGDRWLDLSG